MGSTRVGPLSRQNTGNDRRERKDGGDTRKHIRIHGPDAEQQALEYLARAKVPASPSDEPGSQQHGPLAQTSLKIRSAVLPRAIRIPISRVRCATV